MIFLLVTILVLFPSYVLCEFERLVDLTWHFDNETIYWIDVQPFKYTRRVANDELGYWYADNDFACGEHVGTHLDGPYHFYRHGWKVGEIPVERFIAKGALLDLENEWSNEPIVNLEVKHLEKWEKENGCFETGTVLIIKFGRSRYWYNSTKYYEMDRQRNLNFPGVSKNAAQWLANSGKFYGVGLDTPSIDPGRSTDFMAHRLLTEKQIYILENVKLLEELPAKGFTLLVMPMKLREGSGAPVRIIAVPKNIFDD